MATGLKTARVFVVTLCLFTACSESFSPNTNPIPVPNHRLAVSGTEVCLLETTGSARCWGQQGARRLVPAEGLTFVSLSGGVNHMCGLANDSSAYCWGRSNLGQLGNGRTTGGLRPERVVSNTKFISVAASAYASCALDAVGLLYCWGTNMHAGLANGRWSDSEIALTPQRALSNVQFRDQYAGCVLSLADIRYCWTTAGSSFSLTGMYPVAGDCKAFFYVDFTGNDCLAPTPLAGNIKSKTVGGCLVKVDGVMFCYGIGERGELGDGRYGVGVYAVEPVPVSSDVRFKKASNLCALSVDGSPYCWGNNAFGQLGIGERGGFATVPTKVATDIRFVDIAGVTNTCALTAEDDVWCWGPNEYGTNGPTATGAFALVPVRVEFPPL